MHEPQNLTFSIAESSGDVGQPPKKEEEDGGEESEKKKRTIVNQVQTTSTCVFSKQGVFHRLYCRAGCASYGQ